MNTKHSHYKKDVSHLHTLDVYRVIDLFKVTDPCIQHALKKLLAAGERGAGKDFDKDIQEAIDSLQRLQEMRKEDAKPKDGLYMGPDGTYTVKNGVRTPFPDLSGVFTGQVTISKPVMVDTRQKVTPEDVRCWESAAAHGMDSASHDPVTLNPTQLSTGDLSIARSRMPMFTGDIAATSGTMHVNGEKGIL